MMLFILLLLSTALALINIEPLKTAGVFLTICYLPGFTIFSIAKKRDKLLFEDLLLAFPLSIGTSCALILGLLFVGVHLKFLFPIILMMAGMAVIYHLINGKKSKVVMEIEINRQEAWFMFFALIVTLLLSSPYIFGPNRISIAGHAFHHSLMVSQIMNGIFPPENPGLGGTSIGYYWGFHALIAAITTKSSLHQLQVVFILNFLSLFFILCISYRFAKAFNIAEGYCYIMPLAVIGLMHSDAGILFLVKLLSGSLASLKEITASPKEPLEVLMGWLSGLPLLDTRQLFLRKFFHVSGMPLAICLCFAYLLTLLMVIKENVLSSKIYYVNLGIIIFASLFTYPPLAIFLLLHAPLWTCYIFLAADGNFKEKFNEASKIALPYIIAVLIIAPYILLVIKSREISSGGQGRIFSFGFYEQSLKNIVTFLVPIPAIAYGAWVAFKKLSLSKEFIFLFIGTGVCLILTLFTKWPFDNSYKYNYILLFFLSLFFVFALSDLLARLNNIILKCIIMTGIVLCLSFTPLLINASSIISSFSTNYTYTFSNGHIFYSPEKQKNKAFAWIRENTPVNALLMLSYVETKWPCCAMNNNYEDAAFAERTLYVIKDTDYTTSNPEYAKRIRFREQIFEKPEDPETVEYFVALKRSVYLIVEEGRKDLAEDRFDAFPDHPGRPFELVYRNDRQRVYLVKY